MSTSAASISTDLNDVVVQDSTLNVSLEANTIEEVHTQLFLISSILVFPILFHLLQVTESEFSSTLESLLDSANDEANDEVSSKRTASSIAENEEANADQMEESPQKKTKAEENVEITNAVSLDVAIISE